MFALAALRSETLAWQFAITLTFVATVIDLTDDLGPESGLETSALLRWSLLLLAAIACAALVAAWQLQAGRSLRAPLLGLVWACLGVAYARILFTPAVLQGEGLLPLRFVQAVVDHGIVHGIFTATAVGITIAALCVKGDVARA